MDVTRYSQSVPIEYVRRYPNLTWNLQWLSHNSGLTLDDVMNLQLPNAIGNWNWMTLAAVLDIDDILANPLPELMELSDMILINNINMRADYVPQLPRPPYSTDIAPGRYLPIDDIRRNIISSNIRGTSRFNIDVYDVLYNPLLTVPNMQNYVLAHVRKYPHLPWHHNAVTYLRGILLSDLDLLNIPKTPETIARISEFVPLSEVIDNISYAWSRENLSRNHGMTLDYLNRLREPDTAHFQGNWNWYELSRNIPMDDIRANPHLPWDIRGIVSNPEATVADIEALFPTQTTI